MSWFAPMSLVVYVQVAVVPPVSTVTVPVSAKPATDASVRLPPLVSVWPAVALPVTLPAKAVRLITLPLRIVEPVGVHRPSLAGARLPPLPEMSVLALYCLSSGPSTKSPLS